MPLMPTTIHSLQWQSRFIASLQKKTRLFDLPSNNTEASGNRFPAIWTHHMLSPDCASSHDCPRFSCGRTVLFGGGLSVRRWVDRLALQD